MWANLAVFTFFIGCSSVKYTSSLLVGSCNKSFDNADQSAGFDSETEQICTALILSGFFMWLMFFYII